MDLCAGGREGLRNYARTPPSSFPFLEFNDSAWHRSVSGRSGLSCRVPVGTTHGAIPLLNDSLSMVLDSIPFRLLVTLREKIYKLAREQFLFFLSFVSQLCCIFNFSKARESL